MLKCKDIEQGASAYLDGEMNWRQRMAVRVHLFMCHHCKRFIRQFASIKSLAEKAVSQPATDKQVASVMDKIRQSRE